MAVFARSPSAAADFLLLFEVPQTSFSAANEAHSGDDGPAAAATRRRAKYEIPPPSALRAEESPALITDVTFW